MTTIQLPSRKDFPRLLNDMGLIGSAAEIGVHQGSFSAHILENWSGNVLYSIDPWKYQPDVTMDKSNVDDLEHQRCYVTCVNTLREYKSRSKIMRMTSVQASIKFDVGDLDFVYLDARHDYRSVTEDLVSWWPKVKVGGILAGHDYFDKCVRKNLVEVKRAVDTFFQFGQTEQVQATTEDNLTSWFVIKTKQS